jgi:hypothetical protein
MAEFADPEPMPLSIGTRLGPYEIAGFVGAGGMGARGHTEPRTWRCEARYRREFAAEWGPAASEERMILTPCR